MDRDFPRALVTGIILLASVVSLIPVPIRVSADPSIANNADGTSDAIWNFTNPADYVFSNTEILSNNATLERQPTFWWNSTTMADFSGPDSETNIERTRWPGDVTMALSSGPGTLLTLQPGATGEDSWLDKNNPGLGRGASTTLILDGRNPESRPILRFDLSTIPANAVIDGAKLSLYQSAGFGNSFTASLHYVIAQWNEAQACWDDRLTGVSWATKGGDFDVRMIDQTFVDNSLGWKTWNVTQLVDLWYRGLLPNYGMLIQAPNPGVDSDKTFFSSDYAVNPARRPKLDIWYRVIGATSEYISKIGGPGTTAAWKNISWNPSVRDLVSDEFNGVSLDPKWTWTNPPTSYNVGVTTPGSLHVVSSTGVDLDGGTFTGNVMSQELVGDFTATMKYNVNPTANDQKSGLMVLVDRRNWYGIGKTNVGGPRNWRAYATDDAATTVRADVASGNPVPAWVRIQRAGNTFTSSTSTNGLTWTVRDTYTPAFQYTHGIRVGFFVADGLSGTAVTVDVDYIRFTLANDAAVTVQTRIGDTTPVDPSWSGWSPPYPTPATSPMSGTSRYVEYRLAFSVTNPGHMPVIGDVNVSYFRYPPAGTIETNDLVPADLSAWGNFTVVENLNGQMITYEYSLDSGGSWTAVVPPSSLQAVSIATGKIRFRASLSTSDTLVAPSLSEIRLTYTHRLDHFYVTTPPSAVAGAPFSVTVSAKDALNATIAGWTGTVTLAARLTDGVTPGGGILGVTTLAVSAGGTATLPTESYTKAETIRILASFSTATGLSDNTTISPGPVDRIVVTPDNVTLLAFASQVFTAQAYDVYNNSVPGVNFTWAVGGGVGSLNVSWGQIVMFSSNPPAANGTLQASFGAIVGIAQIHVILGTAPWIAISFPVPGALLTGVEPITYTNSSDSVSLRFDYNDGAGWTLIGSTATLNGTYYWDTSALNFGSGSLLATVTNNLTAVNMTVVSPIEVDNTPPTITIGTVVDDQAGTGTLTIAYATDTDAVRVDFTYFDGVWNAVGSDFTVDGTYVWSPGVAINGVTLRAVAVDHVNLTGWDEKQGVGSYIIGPKPPSIAPVPDLHVSVSATYRLNLTFYVSDPDTPLAALTIWDSDPANVTANPGVYPSLDVTYGVAGTYIVTLWVSDGSDTAWTMIRIIASAQSPPALLAPLPTVIFDEDTVGYNGFGAPATAFFNDLDGDPLSFTVLDAANISSLVNANDTIDFWAPLHWFGSEMLRLRAMDPSNGFAEGAFLVIVRHVNHPPDLVTPFPAVTFNENTTAFDAFGGNATSHFSDVDGDPLTISILGSVNVNSLINPNGTVDLWGATNWSGSETLTVRATDPLGAFADGMFLVTVMPVNHPPIVLSPLPTVTFDEDTVAYDVFGGPVSVHFFDRNGDPLTFTISGGVQVSSLINANLTVDLWAAANWYGSENLLVRATDPNGTYAEALFVVTVRPVNDPPVLVMPFPSVSFDEDTVALDVFGGDATTHFFDVDGDPLVISVLGGVSVSSRINPGGSVDFWAAANWFGTENLRVRATDLSSAFAEGTFLVTVRPVNDAPVLVSALPTITFDEDTVATNAFGGDPVNHFLDVDGDLLTVSLVGAVNISFRVNANGTVDFWAPANWFGSETLSLRATDPSMAFAEGAFLVVVRPVNDPPVLAAIGDLRVDDGGRFTIDLTPYISDIDTNISQIIATTDSQYATANGRVLTVGFPAGQSDTAFTVTISDGSASASRSVRISFVPPWWKSMYFLSIFPISILLVVGMLTQRARWRPAKAFLVDERRRLLREFTLDPRCEVTYDQAYEAGALDAVEKAVKVEGYHAQTVQGDALAVCLLAYGPVSMEQVEFAREMLVNIQDKFAESVKVRLEAARTAEDNLQASTLDIQAERGALSARSRAFAEAMDATTHGMSRLAVGYAAIAAKATEVDSWKTRLVEKQSDLGQLEKNLVGRKVALDARAMQLETREGRLGRFEEDSKCRLDELDAQAKTVDVEWDNLDSERKEFEAVQDEKGQRIVSKEIELETREQSLLDKESALRTQAEENAHQLSDIVTREEVLENETESIEKARTELAARQEEIDQFSKKTETKAAALREEETRKTEEFRSWQGTIESQQALLREQRDTFEREVAEHRQSWEMRIREIEQHEAALAEQDVRFRADLEQAARTKDELARREAEAQKNLRAAVETQMIAEALKKSTEERAIELEQRERALREEAARLTEEFTQRATALKDSEAGVVAKMAQVEQDFATYTRQINDRQAEIDRNAKALEEKGNELSQREASFATTQVALRGREERITREEADLTATIKRFEGREVEQAQAIQRNEEESEHLRAETEELRQSLATKEAELQTHRERLERESTVLQDRLGIEARKLAEREKVLAIREADVARDRQNLDAERATWTESKEKQTKRQETTELDLADQTQRSERLLEEIQRRTYIALEAEKTAAHQADELKVLQVQFEERRTAAESAERTLETQTSHLNEASRHLAEREIKLQTHASELQSREAKLAATAQQLTKGAEELGLKRAALNQEATRLEKSSSELEAKRADVEDRWKAVEAKQTDVTQREQILTSEFQHMENKMEDLENKETEIKSREQFITTIQKEVSKRETYLAKREDEVRRGMEDLEKARKESKKRVAEIESGRAEVTKAREEAAAIRTRAEKEKAQADAMQKEVSKNMKFLQKQALETLDKEERLRDREEKITEIESALKNRDEILQSKERVFDVQREQLATKAERAQAEVAKLKERLADVEKSGPSMVEMEEWRRDLENRVKIVQKKAMDILDREEKLRKKENDLRSLAEKLGVRVDDVLTTSD